MAGLGALLEEFREWPTTRDGASDNPFRLACVLGDPAMEREINSAWPKGSLPHELFEFWRVCGEARLFVDVDYGQWGLHLLTPGESAARTADERLARPSELGLDDVVAAEFLGDQELLVISSKLERTRLLVALPLDERKDWFDVGDSLEVFLQRYLASSGQKFWE